MAASRPRPGAHGTTTATAKACFRRPLWWLASVASVSYLTLSVLSFHLYYKHGPGGDDGIGMLGMEAERELDTAKIAATRLQLRSENGPSPRCKCVDCPDDEICGSLWVGDRYPGMPSNETVHQRRVHVVVSHCRKPLDWLEKYLDGYNVASIHVISKCGVDAKGAPPRAEIERLTNAGGFDHTYAHYINTVLPQKLVAKKKKDDDDSVVAFLKDDVSDVSSETSRQDPFRIVGLGSMISVASSSNGFACGIVPRSFSSYHDKETLFRFTMDVYDRGVGAYKDLYKKMETVDSDFKSPYENLGAFFESLGITIKTPDLVQVCYGGVFAASVRRIHQQDAAVWKKMEDLLTRGNNIEEGHFAERSWAHLLAKPLKLFQVQAMRNVTTGLIMTEDSVMGALGDEMCGGCWKGNRYAGMLSKERALRKKIHVVVSYCNSPLDWLEEYLKGFNVADIHIVSICGLDVEGAPASSEIESLPNIGSCDHAYAHYITTILPRKIGANGANEDDDSVVAFLKDDVSAEDLRRSGLRVKDIKVIDFATIISVASSSNGFGCSLFPSNSVSAYHDKEALFQFGTGADKDRAKSYREEADGAEYKTRHENLGAFFESLNVTRKNPDLVQVCYGGVFAASVRSIHQQDAAVWRRMEDLLAGGGDFVFAERSWAHLLAKPLEPSHVKAVREYATGFLQQTRGMAGALHKSKDRKEQKSV